MINFVGKKKVLAGIISMCVQGLNFGIDFVGGTAMDVKLGTEYTRDVESDLKSIVQDVAGSDAQIQKTGNGDEAYIRTGA